MQLANFASAAFQRNTIHEIETFASKEQNRLQTHFLEKKLTHENRLPAAGTLVRVDVEAFRMSVCCVVFVILRVSTPSLLVLLKLPFGQERRPLTE